MLLGIETAAERVGVALADDEGVRAAVWVRGVRRHAEVLAPAVGHLLEQAEASLADVEVVAVDVGPGLFTGLRVGVATAQGLAQGLGIGVIGVTSVAVLAREAYDAGWQGDVEVVVDARRKEVFAARYAGRTDEVEPPARRTPAALAASLSADADRLLVVGTGAQRYPDAFAHLHVAAITAPSPAALVAVAVDRLCAGREPVAPSALRPVYLREADARINWASR
ncbi:MAG: tRNA (adenosine(37)-N6)-threonylcarbamoyltransferase complex dimerization subunit type 1 TsaB [Acidimicrobiales bacterium]